MKDAPPEAPGPAAYHGRETKPASHREAGLQADLLTRAVYPVLITNDFDVPLLFVTSSVS
jgi:hypothetical protein